MAYAKAKAVNAHFRSFAGSDNSSASSGRDLAKADAIEIRDHRQRTSEREDDVAHSRGSLVHAKISRMTSPLTSVRRKSRPA